MNRLGDLGVVPMEDDDDDDRSPILENPLRFISVSLGDLATKLLTLSSAPTSLLLLPPAHGEIHGRGVCRVHADAECMQIGGLSKVGVAWCVAWLELELENWREAEKRSGHADDRPSEELDGQTDSVKKNKIGLIIVNPSAVGRLSCAGSEPRSTARQIQ